VAHPSEIKKLEQRYRENPKGRNFAPLADAYRKAGLLDHAIELCQSGLQRHPDYVSAHIVYGRCLIDQKNDPAAIEAFRRVLALDSENVLALKMLAEIAERGGRFDEAVEWLGKLVNVDPMNEDAADALARTKRKVAPAAAAPAPVPAAPPAPAVPPVRPVSPAPRAPPAQAPPAATVPPVQEPPAERSPPEHDFVLERSSGDPMMQRHEPAKSLPGVETDDGNLDLRGVTQGAAHLEGIEVHEEEVAGADLPLIMPEETAPHAPATQAPLGPGAPTAQAGMALGAGAGGGAGAGADDDGAADTAALSQAEPVVTETMAELYLKQGHQEDALRVYQALLAQRPADLRLRARVKALSHGGKGQATGAGAGAGAGESVQTFLRRILAAELRGPRPPPDPVPSGALSLGDEFAAAPPELEPEPDAMAPGAATRPADDTISLDHVFGDEGRRGAARVPEPPPPPLPPGTTGGFSFDQFFGAPPPAPSASAAPAGPEEKGPPRSPGGGGGGGPKARRPAEDEGDLDQFQAWLKGLKS